MHRDCVAIASTRSVRAIVASKIADFHRTQCLALTVNAVLKSYCARIAHLFQGYVANALVNSGSAVIAETLVSAMHLASLVPASNAAPNSFCAISVCLCRWVIEVCSAKIVGIPKANFAYSAILKEANTSCITIDLAGRATESISVVHVSRSLLNTERFLLAPIVKILQYGAALAIPKKIFPNVCASSTCRKVLTHASIVGRPSLQSQQALF